MGITPHDQCGYIPYSKGLYNKWFQFLLIGMWGLLPFTSLSAQNDLSLSQSVNVNQAQLTDDLNYTVTIYNDGQTDITQVEVACLLPTGLSYLSNSASQGNYDPSTGVWNIGNMAAATDSVVLSISADVVGEGVIYFLTEISSMNEADDDSTPSNGDYREDDIANTCVSVPIKICPILKDTFTLRAPSGLTNYQWYVDSTGTREAITGANSDNYDATRPGAYSFEADQNTCPAGNCCPVILEEECDLEYDLAMIKTADAPTVFQGDTINYTLTIANQGNIPSNDFSVMDSIPTGLAFIDADNGGTLSENIVNWTIPNLLPDSLYYLNVRLEVVDINSAPFVNYAEITDDSSEDYGLIDEDSSPDNDPTNDLIDDHDDITLDVPPGDADDSDIATVVADTTEYDLALIKTANGLDFWPWDTVTYTITVANQGNVNSNAFTVEDIIPTGMTFVDADNGGLELAGVVIWKLLNLGVGETVDLTARFIFSDPSQTPFNNWAEITDDSSEDYGTTDEDSTPDDDPNNDLVNDHDDITLDEPGQDEDDGDTETVRVMTPEYDLALIKTANVSAANLGDTVTYTITIANQGNVNSNDFSVIDIIPQGMSFVSADNAGALDNDSVKWNIPDLLAGETIDLELLLQVDDISIGTLSNWAEILDDSSEDYGLTDNDSSPDGLPNDDNIDHNDITQDEVANDEDDSDNADVDPIPPEYDLALIKTASPVSAEFGATVTYTITVANQGNVSSNDFTVIDILPIGMSFVSADNGGVLQGDTVVWVVPDLADGEMIELEVRLQVDDISNGTFRNWAEISDDSSEDYGLTDDDSTPDNDRTNDMANDHDFINIDGAAGDEDDSDYEDVYPLPLEYDLALIKTANTSEVGSGDNVTYTITVANQGTVDAHDFTVVDYIPTGMSFVSADNGAVEQNGEVTWIIPDLEPDETIDLTIVLKANDMSQGSFSNYAEITDDSSEDYGVTDEDSTPDSDPNNDDVNDHDDITIDTAAGDEDDSDRETVNAIDPGLEPDTIYVTTPYNTQITDICADVSDLPGNYGYTLRCGDPSDGFLQVNSLSNCVNYTPNVGFVGIDEACILVCDDSDPSVCDTTYIFITVEASSCTDFISESNSTLYTNCDEMAVLCVDIPFADVSEFTITDNGTAYANSFAGCTDDPNNLQLELTTGTHLLHFLDLRTGCEDSISVSVNCPLDSTIRNTVHVDGDNEICFAGILEGDIITIENDCPESAGNSEITIDPSTNCIIYTGITVGLDTSCIKICTAPDSCTLFTVVTSVIPACGDILGQDSMTAFVEDCDSLGLVCLDIPLEILIFNYSVKADGEDYDGGFTGCDFDSTVSYSYFTIPDQGSSGPYIIDSWFINGQIFTGRFDDLQGLLDSMNVWDNTSEWYINNVTSLLAGGNPSTDYGDLRITQVSTGNASRLNVNKLLLPSSSALKLYEGEHELIIRDNDTGCEDTIQVDVRCLGPDYVFDTISVLQTDTICLDTFELRGNIVSIDNYCDESSGEFVSYNILDEACLEIEGIDIGQDSACVIICDDLGDCDTTYIFITVLPELIDAVDDADTLVQNSTGFNKDILSNDIISGQLDSIYIVTNPTHGAIQLNDDGSVTYIPNEGYCDSQIPDSLTYAICNMVGCDTATIYFYVFCDDLEIYTGFSPNGDGNNDVFLIDGIEGYPNNTLTIFNRWGNQVYDTQGYLNTWNGKWEGKDLPDGTYFYMLDDGQGRSFTGYVQIHR